MLRPFSSAFLAGEPASRPFLARDFRDRETRIQQAQAAAAGTAHPAALQALSTSAELSAAGRAHLEALAAGRAAVVVTGQQVGLFLGPLYTFYKAASAVVFARALSRESGVTCVPLFWLQTEDHDFAEIDHCHVAGVDGSPHRLRLPDEASRISVAHRCLRPEVTGLLTELEPLLPVGPARDEVMSRLRAHYRGGRPWAAAFAGLLGDLFAEEGLLILDPRQAAIAEAARPWLSRALQEHVAITAGLEACAVSLREAGFDIQIPIRAGAPLVFFHKDGVDGPRFRLEQVAEEEFRLTGPGRSAALSLQGLMALMDREPLRFSTSALLRPVLQDALLPTAAYVGGPGELNYFAQLGPVYQHFGMSQPLFVPRARLRYIDRKTHERLEKLGLTCDDLAQPQAKLLATLAARSSPEVSAATLRARALPAVEAALASLEAPLMAANPDLKRPLQRTRATVNRALDRLLDKYAASVVRGDQITSTRLERVMAALQPEGIPQERFYSWPSLAARMGPAAFKGAVMEAIEPWGTAVRDIRGD